MTHLREEEVGVVRRRAARRVGVGVGVRRRAARRVGVGVGVRRRAAMTLWRAT